MPKLLSVFLLLAGCAIAQSAAPATSSEASSGKASTSTDDLFPPHKLGEKVGLVRGVLERVDSVYDQLVIHTFGGGDLRVGFDPQTKFLPGNANQRSPSLPTGSIVSIDTAIDNGKLYALTVRTDTPRLAELNGQVVGYDATRSRLTLRDPVSPEAVSLRVDSGTRVVNGGQAVSPASLTPGMLIRAWIVSGQNAANEIEILAKPGSTFAFEGQILAVDLRLRVLSLSNDTDQSFRELAFGSLDNSVVKLLREGNEVAIQAEFDGETYNVRTVTLLPRKP